MSGYAAPLVHSGRHTYTRIKSLADLALTFDLAGFDSQPIHGLHLDDPAPAEGQEIIGAGLEPGGLGQEENREAIKKRREEARKSKQS